MRLAVTGMSVTDCMGNHTENNFQKILDNTDGTDIDYEEMKNYCVLEKGFIRRSSLRHFDESAISTLYNVGKAIEDANLDLDIDRDAPVITSSIRGPVATNLELRAKQYKAEISIEHLEGEEWEEAHEINRRKFLKHNPYKWVNTLHDFVPSFVSQSYGLYGPTFQLSSTCSGGLQALEIAKMYLQSGKKYAIVTGFENLSSDTASGVLFESIGAASPDNIVRPFCETRNGTSLKDGCGALIVETEENAKARGATPHVYIEDVQNFNDANNILQPHEGGRGILKSFDAIFKNSVIKPEDVDYINAHGTGTITGDPIELNVMKDIFDEGTPVSSLKGHVGHGLGACGIIETIYTAQMMKHSVATSNKNMIKPIDNYFDILRDNKRMDINFAINNSFGFGGRASTALLSRD